MAAPSPLNTLHAKLDYDRDERRAQAPAAPAPTITLLSEIGMLHTAITAASDELITLINALASVAHPEYDQAVDSTMASSLASPMPESVAGVREARGRVEALSIRLSDLRNRLAL